MINRCRLLAILGMLLWLASIAFIMCIFIPFMVRPARPQHSHDHHRFHAFYQNWISKDGLNCCNDRDCRIIADADVRPIGGVVHVRIEGNWCEVLSKHYLMRGNSPNWDSAHLCVQPAMPDGSNGTPCQRLLCFQPKPLS